MQTQSYKLWLENAKKLCIKSGAEISAPLILLQFYTNKSKAYIISHDENELSEDVINILNSMLNRFLANEPLAYITKTKEFYGRDFFVDENVLIPRPETELIVDNTIDYFKNVNYPISFCDVGTGSGCIALSILAEIENSSCIAYDISQPSINIAKKNAESLQLSNRIQFIHCPIEEAKEETKFDCIVSNPPYIPENEYINLDKNVKDYEPEHALTSGINGFEIIWEVINFAQKNLKPGGLLLIEHGYNQSDQVLNYLNSQNQWAEVQAIIDYAGIKRIAKAVKI